MYTIQVNVNNAMIWSAPKPTLLPDKVADQDVAVPPGVFGWDIHLALQRVCVPVKPVWIGILSCLDLDNKPLQQTCQLEYVGPEIYVLYILDKLVMDTIGAVASLYSIRPYIDDILEFLSFGLTAMESTGPWATME
jgi:hypothetical protein